MAAISELGRRSSLAGALLASLPLTSILALVWLYHDTQNLEKVAQLSNGIALIVLPSLVFFLSLSFLITKFQWTFYPALFASVLGMALTYQAYLWVLSHFGIDL